MMEDVLKVGEGKQLTICENCNNETEKWHFLCPECGEIL